MRYEVTQADTAIALASGDMSMLATPRLIAWMEAATVECSALFLGVGQTTVGTGVRIEHRRPTPAGDSVEIAAEPPVGETGRRLTFVVRATDSSGTVVAAGEIDRAIVNRDGFLARGADTTPER